DGLPQAVDRSFGGLSQRRLELGEAQLDRVEIGAVGRQVEDLGALRLDDLADAGDFMAVQIVEDYDVAGPQCGRQELLDVGAEAGAVDGAVENAGRGDPA